MRRCLLKGCDCPFIRQPLFRFWLLAAERLGIYEDRLEHCALTARGVRYAEVERAILATLRQWYRYWRPKRFASVRAQLRMQAKQSVFRAVKFGAVSALLFATAAVNATTVVPDSTVLPVYLNAALSSRKTKPGEVITARIMQDVPLPGDLKIPAGAKLAGQVTAVRPASGSDGGSISFRFDTLRLSHENVRLVVHLRAIASTREVRHAQLPLNTDPGTAENSWTTVQIGGDVVYRGGGPVTNRSGVVGKPVENGVLGRLDSNPGRGCRGDGTGERAQALWLFSSDACGTYDLEHVTIVRTDRTPASAGKGEITLRSSKGDVNVRTGAGLLLRVDAP